ncbi:enoyl-CoA hydratase [Variovorax sp. WS11]|uniref:enoyl-CoA hydratase/isomerase family protein n=1 Tax=Variovorax sp. WS11 TaxID=1105204 RepID=UPI000D0DDAEF|nr:enoyl-CoA hydratase/isomerase family protein [Variovorax sp. WS11]NDZ18562.1 enoyl-CoA hydratase/isomerase family protein [Variovorax sp. WS11]PSL85192.1 enoyl-CoA hydratase [Variovorax sp. WS11]
MSKDETPVDGMVLYEKRDGKAYVTFNRPEKRNALTYAAFDLLMACIADAEQDDDVRVVIITGAGGHFSAGHDLAEIGSEYGFDPSGKGRRPSQRARLDFDRRHLNQFRDLFYCSKPTIALVRGYCVGAGLHIVEACDLAIASDAARIGHPEQKAGLAGAAYMTAWNILAAGPKKARELLLIADMLKPEEAVQMGLVNKVVPDAELERAGEDWAERIAKLPRDAIAFGKAATNLALDSLGMTSQFAHGYVMHALSTNIRYEEDEYNFMKKRRDEGVRSASHGREERYGDEGRERP